MQVTVNPLDQEQQEASKIAHEKRRANYERVKAIARVFCPSGRRYFGPHMETRMYRGKRRVVVGYSWSRLYSHHFNGLVYDAVVAYGDTADEAIESLYAKAAKLRPATPPAT